MKRKFLLSSFLAAGFMVSGTVHAAEPGNNTVDGTATYISTGEIVPSDIEFTGYDIRSNKMYLNVTVASDSSLPNSVPYSIDVFNYDSSQTLLNDPYNKVLEPGTSVSKVTDSNIELQLKTSLDKSYRINVEIDTE